MKRKSGKWDKILFYGKLQDLKEATSGLERSPVRPRRSSLVLATRWRRLLTAQRRDGAAAAPGNCGRTPRPRAGRGGTCSRQQCEESSVEPKVTEVTVGALACGRTFRAFYGDSAGGRGLKWGCLPCSLKLSVTGPGGRSKVPPKPVALGTIG